VIDKLDDNFLENVESYDEERHEENGDGYRVRFHNGRSSWVCKRLFDKALKDKEKGAA